MSLAVSFPNSLKRIRLSHGFSQEELSGLAGLDRTYVSMLERGVRNPSLLTIEKISLAFEMEVWEFIKAL